MTENNTTLLQDGSNRNIKPQYTEPAPTMCCRLRQVDHIWELV